MARRSDMKLVRLADRPGDWDQQIQRFPNKTLFHESAWLDYLRFTRPHSRIEYFEIRRGLACVGYFCAVRVRKVVYVCWGSPLPWAGMYMGPVVEPQLDQEELVHLLTEQCRAERIAHLELSNDWLDASVMQAAGFQVDTSVTHVCPLAGGAAAVWAGMAGTCRTRIRKAEKSQLTAESADDPAVVEEFYGLFARVLTNKGSRPSYTLEHARALFHRLHSADRLFVIRVKHQDRLIATGFYPHDDRAMYYLDAGYEPDFLELCPNNLMHWTAMRMAIERGIPSFNMGGGPDPSRFTRKFGGSLQPYLTYHKSFVPFFDQARQVYHFVLRRGGDSARAVPGRPEQ
jgi:Acetyltransferase (GNAT) domain